MRAMLSVICTMGLLIGTGNTVHIMSSMIPIFIMPIAVLDAVHILSEFYDRYQTTGDKEKTVRGVIAELHKPMLYTSFTSAAGFVSLAFTPIPPVQVFGIFVGLGILLAWLFTMIFIPAFIMLTDEKALANFGHAKEKAHDGLLGNILAKLQQLTFGKPGVVIGSLAFLTALCGYGITKIQINDNPVKWFTEGHPIRVADDELNAHFGGTYIAYLNFEASEVETPFSKDDLWTTLRAKFQTTYSTAQLEEIQEVITNTTIDAKQNPYNQLSEVFLDLAYDNEDNDDLFDFYETISDAIALQEIATTQIFKQPAVLN
ncbi:MAG: MMPL family transporter [Bacteroidota bacterium]